MSMSRRRFLCAAAASALSLGGCNRQRTASTLHLRFWNGFTGPDGRAMLDLVKAFNASQTRIHVSMQRIEWAIYYNKLFVAGLDGRSPDVFVCHASVMARMIEAGFLSPVDALLLTSTHIDPTDFEPNILNQVQSDGATWGLPLDVHPLGMYLNRRLFEDAGLCDASGSPLPPTDRTGFVHSLRLLHKPGSPSVNGAWGFVFTWLRPILYTVLRQWGGNIFAEDGVEVVLDSEANATALTFLVDSIHRDKLIPEPTGARQDGLGFIGFRQGRVGMVFEGIFMLSELQKQRDLDYLAAPLPQLGPQPAAWADSHVLCVPSSLSKERRVAAAEFISFISDHSLAWAAAGQIPARRSLRQTPAFNEMPAQAAFARQLPYLAYLPRVPYVLEYQSIFDVLAERVLRGVASPERCLKEAAEEMRRAVKLYQTRGAPG